MKRFLSILAMGMCLIAIHPQDANAQLSKLLKKTKKVLSEVTGSNSSTTSTETAKFPKIAEVKLANGVKMVNACYKYADIVSVRAIGKSQDNMVYVTIKIKPKDLNYKSVYFGRSPNAFDDNGDEYESTVFSDIKSVVVDVPAKFEFAKLKKVPARVKRFTIVQSGFSFDGETDRDAKVIFKDLPIEWDVKE